MIYTLIMSIIANAITFREEFALKSRQLKTIDIMTNTYTLQSQSLSCERGDRLLFSDINFSLKSSEGLHIVGANGSGKTSLLRILAGLAEPESGVISYQGKDIKSSRQAYAANFCFVGHAAGVNKQLSPRENCQFMMQARGKKLTIQSIDKALEQVELLGFEEEMAGTLSAGQQRRIALAQLLLSDTPLWLLDEPYTALDRLGIEILDTIFTEHLNKQGLLIFASHQDSALDSYAGVKKIHLQK